MMEPGNPVITGGCMHILALYKDYAPVVGGIENNLRDLAEGMARRGHQMTVLVTNTSGTTEIIERPNLTIIKAARALHAASTPISPAMLRFARQLRPDVAHLHFPYPPGDLAYWRLPTRPPLVMTYHSDIVRQKTLRRLYGPLQSATLRHAARICVTSPQYATTSQPLQPYLDKCVVVPLAVDTSRFAQRDAAAVTALRDRFPGPLLLFVGRLRYYKGLHFLLDALGHVQARLLIAGSGPEEGRLREQVQAQGLTERVHFLGDVPDADLPTLYHAADVFVLPAHLRAEALGIVQIEALASGTPCVSTAIGTGTSFVNQHGETGFVVPPAHPLSLARAINVLLANPALRAHFGANGQRRAASIFSMETMLNATEQVYREALST